MIRYTLCLFVLFALCFMKSRCSAQILNLRDGEICRRGDGYSPDSICRELAMCMTARQGIRNEIVPTICSFKGKIPVVCCPPKLIEQTTNESTTTKKKFTYVAVKTFSATKNIVQKNNESTTTMHDLYDAAVKGFFADENIVQKNNESTTTMHDLFDAAVKRFLADESFVQTTTESTTTMKKLTDTAVKALSAAKSIVQSTTESTTTMKKLTDTAVKALSAAEMCYKYSELAYTRIKISKSNKFNNFITVRDCPEVRPFIVGGTKVVPKEFPHMALLGYGEKVDNIRWGCGGSLISDKWILTAAHCEKSNRYYARWARLGDLNYRINTDLAEPKNYEIVERVIHPNYRPPVMYNDIALFRLEKIVEFSSYIRPICINTEQFLKTSKLVVTGWGKTGFDQSTSHDLLKVTLNTVSIESCNAQYAGSVDALPNGIVNTMLCAGTTEDDKGSCEGDSGGPILTPHSNYTCMYTQIGVTSFGSQICGKKNSPTVYTKVSKYISWIEQIVWPKE